MIAASSFLAGEARSLGARDVRVVPFGVAIPDVVAPPAEPPHVLFAGRLSEEKGILEFVEATAGLPRVIVGDGPLRSQVPDAVGFVAPREVGAYYERAAVVCVPSRREGYGFSAREAMAYGRPSSRRRVGGLTDAVLPDVTGVLAPASELRGAIERLLEDTELRDRLGTGAREHAQAHFSYAAAAARLLTVYHEALA